MRSDLFRHSFFSSGIEYNGIQYTVSGEWANYYFVELSGSIYNCSQIGTFAVNIYSLKNGQLLKLPSDSKSEDKYTLTKTIFQE